MNIINKKKIFLAIIIALVFAMSSGAHLFSPIKNFAQADDEEEEEREEADDDDDNEDVETVTVQEEKVEDVKPKKTTKTITIKEPDRVVTTTSIQTIVLVDSDQDGIIDSEDPHPQIAEIYIVVDDNKNGIADWLENGK